MILLGDHPIYKIEGMISVEKPEPVSKLSLTKGSFSCRESRVYRPFEMKFDDTGHFVLDGYGAPSDCVLILEHPDFEPAVVKLDPDLRLDPKGLFWHWKLNVTFFKKENK